MSLSMFIVNQPTTTPDQIVYFKSQPDSQRYWNFFVENKDVISPQYVNPLLMAGKGYTYRQLQELDFLDCILPIPLFSGRFVEKNKEMLRDELLFFPCRINICDKVVEFFLGSILNTDSILDVQHSGCRKLTDGTSLPDSPFVYRAGCGSFHILRDSTYKSHYIVFNRFADLCKDFKMELKPVYETG